MRERMMSTRDLEKIEVRIGEFRSSLVGVPESLDAMNQQQRLCDLENLVDEVRRLRKELEIAHQGPDEKGSAY
jgi:hypothetical protein